MILMSILLLYYTGNY